MTPDELDRLIEGKINAILDSRERRATTRVATIDPGFTAGNPVLELRKDESGSKTDKIEKPFDYFFTWPAADDRVTYNEDKNGGRIVGGKIADAGSDYWVEPGDTEMAAADTEQTTTSSSFVDVKIFEPPRPGRYRLVFDMAEGGGTPRAQVEIQRADGTRITASAAITSTAVYPTFQSRTLDMTVTARENELIVVLFRNDVAGQDAYIKNVKLKYQNATAMPTLRNTVLLD